MWTDRQAPPRYKPGDRVAIVGPEAQAVVGIDHGIVVGDTAGQPAAEEIKVVVTPQAAGDVPNAVVSPADIQPDPPQHE